MGVVRERSRRDRSPPTRFRRTSNWHKRQGRDRIDRHSKPVLHRAPIDREGAAKRAAVLFETPPRGSAVRNHHPDSDDRRPPATGLRDVGGEPPISIDLPNEATDVVDSGLDLDDQQHTTLFVPSQDVDRSALAEDRKRHLRLRGPAGKAGKPPQDVLHHRCVMRVEEPAELTAVPPRDEITTSVKCCEDPSNDGQRSRVQTSGLETGDRRGRDVRCPAQVDLRPAPVHAQRLDCSPDLEVVHDPRMIAGAYARLMGPGFA
jgi:hypothetical protein